MADPLSGGGPVTQPKNNSWLARLDFTIYRVEQALAWGMLLLMAVGYFLSILDRELTAGAGQNSFDQFALKRLGHTAETVDPALLETIHSVWGPIVALSLTLLLLGIAAFTQRRPGEESTHKVTLGEAGRFFGLSLVVLGAAVGLMLALPSPFPPRYATYTLPGPSNVMRV